MKMAKTFSLARDFSRSPSGRYLSDGPNSGERFRDDFLYPSLMEGDVVVELDGVLTLGSSFLDEAFGGLVRSKGFSPSDLRKKLLIKSSIQTYVTKIWSYIDAPRAKK